MSNDFDMTPATRPHDFDLSVRTRARPARRASRFWRGVGIVAAVPCGLVIMVAACTPPHAKTPHEIRAEAAAEKARWAAQAMAEMKRGQKESQRAGVADAEAYRKSHTQAMMDEAGYIATPESEHERHLDAVDAANLAKGIEATRGLVQIGKARIKTGEYGTRTIEGVIENQTGEPLSYVQVVYRILDKHMNQADTAMTNTLHLAAGARWHYSIPVMYEERGYWEMAEMTGH